MESPGLLTLQLWLVGIPIAAWWASRWLSRLPDDIKADEQAAMREAMDADAPRSQVRDARKRLEGFHDEHYMVTRTLEALSASGRLPLAYLFLGLLWPALGAALAFLRLRRAARWAWARVTGDHVECDACEKAGPWGWTFRRAQRKAAEQGWAVNLPNKEDLCPNCVATEWLHSGN